MVLAMARLTRAASARPLVLLVAVITLGGCADMMKLTPQQEVTYRNFEACRGRTATFQLTRVNPDGSFSVSGDGGGEFQRITQCMRERGHRFRGD